MELLVKISIIFTINDDISISKLESLNVESFINQYFLIKILTFKTKKYPFPSPHPKEKIDRD